MSSTLEHQWELKLPAATPEQLLAALAARDRLFGQTVTLEPEDEPEAAVEAWFGTADLLQGGSFCLMVYGELNGPEEYLEAAREALDDILAAQVEAGSTDAVSARLIERRPASEIEFRMVEEDEERAQLVIPEWLAPSAELDLPWSFRSFERSGEPWPSEKVIADHDRLAVVPAKDELLLYALPTIEEEEE